MTKGVIYEIATGRVSGARRTSLPEFLPAQYPDESEYDLLEGGGSSKTSYVDISTNPCTIQTKATLSADFDSLTVTAAGSSYVTLATLPIPCTVYVDNVAIVVDDGSFEFDADSVGEYKIRVDEVTFLEKEWIINAN